MAEDITKFKGKSPTCANQQSGVVGGMWNARVLLDKKYEEKEKKDTKYEK